MKIKSTNAIAVFVKTPGLSPIKTRLARTLGQQNAEEFYRLSVAAIQELISKTSSHLNITPYWAVAEPKGLDSPLWNNFETVYQGEGELGPRLDTIYRLLKQKHSHVILIGVDCPQMAHEDFSSAITKLNQVPFVMGKSLDGGFYLFGGSKGIPSKIWTSVPYSVNTTAETLEHKLLPYGKMDYLPERFDIDTQQELSLLSQLPLEPLLPEQRRVVTWANQFK